MVSAAILTCHFLLKKCRKILHHNIEEKQKEEKEENFDRVVMEIHIYCIENSYLNLLGK